MAGVSNDLFWPLRLRFHEEVWLTGTKTSKNEWISRTIQRHELKKTVVGGSALNGATGEHTYHTIQHDAIKTALHDNTVHTYVTWTTVPSYIHVCIHPFLHSCLITYKVEPPS